MILEFFEAIFKAAIPLAVFSFALIYWGLHFGHFSKSEGVAELHREMKATSKNDRKSKGKSRYNPVYSKWFKFGGGFYGAVALFTYGLVEWYEFVDFLGRVDGIGHMLSQLNIGLLVNIVVEGFTNFIVAITWPAYWISEIETDRIWLWCIAAYGGYYGGAALAHYIADQHDATAG